MLFRSYEINKILKEKNILVKWTILGKGPETNAVVKQWQGERNVDFYCPSSQKEVMEIISNNDILVFPTKFEGFPVAVLESMSLGCVPIATDLLGGTQEVVKDGLTGYRCKMDDHIAFASKIEKLFFDRKLMQTMKVECIKMVSEQFNVLNQAKLYQDYFKEVALEDSVPRHHLINEKIGSRLDQKYLPNRGGLDLTGRQLPVIVRVPCAEGYRCLTTNR